MQVSYAGSQTAIKMKLAGIVLLWIKVDVPFSSSNSRLTIGHQSYDIYMQVNLTKVIVSFRVMILEMYSSGCVRRRRTISCRVGSTTCSSEFV